MTEEKPKLFARENVRQVFAALVVSLGGFSLGASLGWASPAFTTLEESSEFKDITDQEKSWIASIVALGAFTSSPIAGFCISKFGRKLTLISVCPPYVLGWLLVAYAINLPMMLSGRFITGLCGGIVTLTSPIYIAEVATDALRGTMGSAFMVMIILGIITTYGVGAITTYVWMSIFNAFIPFVLMCLVMWVPESPIYLLTKNKPHKARVALKWLRNHSTEEQIMQELQKMENQVEENKRMKVTWRDLLGPQCLRPTLISMMLAMLNQLSGVQAVLSYASEIVESTNTGVDPNLSAILLGLSVIFASAFMDKAGRRFLLLVSEIGMSVCFAAIGTFFYLKEQNDGENPSGLAWLPIAGLIVYIMAYAIGIGPLPRVVLSEIIPLHVKGQAASIAFMFNWILAFAVTKTFEDLTTALNDSGFFWLYSGICFFGCFLIFFYVPETKGKSFTEIEHMFQSGKFAFAKPTPTEGESHI